MIAFLTRRRVAIPATLALAVLGLTILGGVDPGGWVALTPAYEHSTSATVLICILLIVTLVGIRTTNWWLYNARIVLATTLAFVALVALLVTHVFSQELRIQQQIAAPDGHPYRLVIAEGHDVIDPVWTLSIHSGSGLRTREWRFGCLNGDAYVYDLHSAVWDGPGQVVVTIGDDDALRRVVVPIDTETGRPSGSANTWDGCDS
jgi:hypothetical protein